MKPKEKRIETLRRIVSTRQMSSQEEVLQALAENGISVLQSTLSRDMKQLKIVKVAQGGRYVYVLPSEVHEGYRRVHRSTVRIQDLPGFVSLNFSGNIGVIKTLPGYAGGVAYHIDNAGCDEILGTIAGDDTIFFVRKEGVADEDIFNLEIEK